MGHLESIGQEKIGERQTLFPMPERRPNPALEKE
jgi:hypothetical protein